MKYKQIIFDIDGTLIDTECAAMHSLQQTIQTVTGKFYEIEDLLFSFGITAAETMGRLQVPDVESAIHLWDKNMRNCSGSVKIFDGIVEVLDVLVEKGYGLGIVTSKTHSEFEQDFSRFGLNHYFTTVVCADDTKAHKPNPDPLLKYMELTGTTDQEILYIGDSVYDLRCTNAAKADFAVAGWGTKSLKPGDAVYYAETPKDLLKFL